MPNSLRYSKKLQRNRVSPLKGDIQFIDDILAAPAKFDGTINARSTGVRNAPKLHQNNRTIRSACGDDCQDSRHNWLDNPKHRDDGLR
ncbi:hypothetical protein D3C79_900350 [compost metagenome]